MRKNRTWASQHGHIEFEKYEANRLKHEAVQPTSDFDKFLEKTTKLKITAGKALPLHKKGVRSKREKHDRTE